MQRPFLYLSAYLKAHRAEYYDHLMAIRNDGNWEGWIKFFLRGVHEVSEATATARAILDLREKHRRLVADKVGANGAKLLDYLYEQPIVTVRLVERHLQCSFVTANNLIDQFERLALLSETTGGARNRRFRYTAYLALFEPSKNSGAKVRRERVTGPRHGHRRG